MKKRSCYITGKMRCVKALNFPLFNTAAGILRADDWNVISPAEMDREANEPWTSETDPDFADENFVIEAQDCRRLIRRDVEAILTLRPENGDVVILLPGWDDDSTGAFGESGVARWAQVPLQEFQFVQIPRIYCRMPGDAPLKPYSLTTLTEDEWGAKANMRATDKHGDD
jgi:hypothetical protein